jgi:hypothetical protein
MIEKEIGNGELTSVLEGMNWDYLVKKKKEFIVKMVIKKLKSQGWKVSGFKDRKKVIVSPVTVREAGIVIGGSIHVYDQFRGWEGELISRKGENCKVRIRKDEDSNYVTTFILNKDLVYV